MPDPVQSYIVQELKKGFSKKEIFEKLVKTGYDPKKVREILNSLSENETTHTKKGMRILALIIFLAMIMIGLFFLFFTDEKKEVVLREEFEGPNTLGGIGNKTSWDKLNLEQVRNYCFTQEEVWKQECEAVATKNEMLCSDVNCEKEVIAALRHDDKTLCALLGSCEQWKEALRTGNCETFKSPEQARFPMKNLVLCTGLFKPQECAPISDPVLCFTVLQKTDLYPFSKEKLGKQEKECIEQPTRTCLEQV